MAESAIKKDTYSIPNVIALRRKIRDGLLKTYLDTRPTGDAFEIFVDDVLELLPKTCLRRSVFDSLTHLAGEKLTRDIIDTNAWRLAGNQQRLTKPIPVPPWTRQHMKEWVPAQVFSARRRRGPKNKLGYIFTFKILAGLSCPLAITKFWSNRLCYYAAPILGFTLRIPPRNSKRLARNLFRHPTELVGMRLRLLIDPALCGSEPGFEKFAISPSLHDYNRTLLKYRDRLPVERDSTDYSCPRRFPLSVLCHQCTTGWQNCRAGCHRLDYTFDFCRYCGREKAPFDLDLSPDMCVECYERKALAQQQ